MKHISKKVREEAALILSMAASNDIALSSAFIYVDAGNEVWPLMFAAKHVANAELFQLDDEARYYAACAEAESMIRTGWSPS